jgi:PAS domain S-box-containing protein
MIGATQDITRRKLAELKLAESEGRFRSLVQNGLDLVAILDTEANYTYVSPAVKQVLGYDADALLGKNAFLFIHPEDCTHMLRQFKLLKNRRYIEVQPFRFRNKEGGWRWIETKATNLLDDPAIQGIVVNSADITEKVLLETKLAEERSIRHKEITEAVLTAQENERSDIGKDLHDNLNQILGATKLYIESARTDKKNRDLFLTKSSAFIMIVIEEIRRISKTLATPGIHTMGLFDSIRILLSDLVLINPIKIEFNKKDIVEKDLNEKLQLNIFRIVQEQLNNICKHANATHAAIELSRHEKEIILLISDNGKGWDTSERSKGVGIRNITSRAELCNGKAEIESKPGEGFQLRVSLRCVSPDH